MTEEILVTIKLENESSELISPEPTEETEIGHIKVEQEDFNYNLEGFTYLNEIKNDTFDVFSECYPNIASFTLKANLVANSGCKKVTERDASGYLTKEKRFVCQVCKYKCPDRFRLQIHMRKHTGEKPFACSLCELKFACKSMLARHSKTHSFEKPFKCQTCNFRCARKSNLLRHNKLVHLTEKAKRVYVPKIYLGEHEALKPLSCEFCEYKCKVKHNLIVHRRIHTGDKPFKCAHCLYKSADKSTLRRHLSIHMGFKPFECTICNYKTAEKSKLRRHYNGRHKKEAISC